MTSRPPSEGADTNRSWWLLLLPREVTALLPFTSVEDVGKDSCSPESVRGAEEAESDMEWEEIEERDILVENYELYDDLDQVEHFAEEVQVRQVRSSVGDSGSGGWKSISNPLSLTTLSSYFDLRRQGYSQEKKRETSEAPSQKMEEFWQMAKMLIRRLSVTSSTLSFKSSEVLIAPTRLLHFPILCIVTSRRPLAKVAIFDQHGGCRIQRPFPFLCLWTSFPSHLFFRIINRALSKKVSLNAKRKTKMAANWDKRQNVVSRLTVFGETGLQTQRFVQMSSGGLGGLASSLFVDSIGLFGSEQHLLEGDSRVEIHKAPEEGGQVEEDGLESENERNPLVVADLSGFTVDFRVWDVLLRSDEVGVLHETIVLTVLLPSTWKGAVVFAMDSGSSLPVNWAGIQHWIGCPTYCFAESVNAKMTRSMGVQ